MTDPGTPGAETPPPEGSATPPGAGPWARLRRVPEYPGELWWSLSLVWRRRVAVGATALLVLLLVFLAWRVLFGPSPPRDDAVKVTPANSLVYAHANLDRGSGQFKTARDVTGRFPQFPVLAGGIVNRVGAITGQPIDFQRDVRPWLGGEAALAVVPTTGDRAGSVLLLDVGDKRGAQRFLESAAEVPPRTSKYRNTELRAYAAGFTSAFAGDFLAVGNDTAVKRVVDVEAGRARSLAQDPVAKKARGELPEDRLADAYASADGVRRVVAPEGGPIGQIGNLINNPALEGSAAALVAHQHSMDVELFSALDPEKNRANPGFGAFTTFEPTLTEEIGGDALAYAGVANLAKTFDRLLDRAQVSAPGVASGFKKFEKDLAREGKIELKRDLLPLLRGETAVAVERGSRRTPPYLTGVTTGVDEKKARAAMARLQGPIARTVDTERGSQAPTFDDRKIDGVQAFSLRLSPNVDLTYAIFDSKLVVSTSPDGIKQVKSGEDNLSGSDLYREAVSDLPNRVSSVLFLDLGGLVDLAERRALAEDPAYATIRADLQRLKALAIGITGDEDDLKAELSLTIE